MMVRTSISVCCAHSFSFLWSRRLARYMCVVHWYSTRCMDVCIGIGCVVIHTLGGSLSLFGSAVRFCVNIFRLRRLDVRLSPSALRPFRSHKSFVAYICVATVCSQSNAHTD